MAIACEKTLVTNYVLQYPNSPFILPTPMHPTVILPRSCINELKNMPEEIISLR
jgi:hypothetical protein